MTFYTEVCILFLYHRCDDVTKYHLKSLRDSNPHARIIPLTDTVPELLPESVDVGVFRSDFAQAKKWRSIDTTLYRWFINRTFDAEKYIVIEYDCFCNVDLREHYTEVWRSDVAGVDMFTREQNPRWKWFSEGELSTVPPEDREYAAGLVPFTCTMFSHAALQTIVANVYRNDVFCELRLGTLINKHSLNFKALPVQKRCTVCYHEYSWARNRAGLFHSIKSLNHNAGKFRQPGVKAAAFFDFARSLTKDREFLPFQLKCKTESIRRIFRVRS